MYWRQRVGEEGTQGSQKGIDHIWARGEAWFLGDVDKQLVTMIPFLLKAVRWSRCRARSTLA